MTNLQRLFEGTFKLDVAAVKKYVTCLLSGLGASFFVYCFLLVDWRHLCILLGYLMSKLKLNDVLYMEMQRICLGCLRTKLLENIFGHWVGNI